MRAVSGARPLHRSPAHAGGFAPFGAGLLGRAWRIANAVAARYAAVAEPAEGPQREREEILQVRG